MRLNILIDRILTNEKCLHKAIQFAVQYNSPEKEIGEKFAKYLYNDLQL